MRYMLPTPEDLTRAEIIYFGWAVAGCPSSQSGVTFSLAKGKFAIESPFPKDKQDCIGGRIVTYAGLDYMENLYLPGIAKRFAEIRDGKIVFLGNGLNRTPVGLSRWYVEGYLKRPPVVVDMLDYTDLYADFQSLKRQLEGQRLPFGRIDGLQTAEESLSQLLKGINSGSVEYVKYCVGSGNPPETIRDASLVVSFFGPAQSTLLEQQSLLAVGGELWTPLPPSRLLPGCSLDTLNNPRSSGRITTGFVIRRNK